MFRPRYVRKYKTKAAVPYVVDNSALTTAGSYGTVRKVRHRKTKEPYAQKTFQKVFSHRDRQKILKELALLELCLHKNTIQLIDAYEVDCEPHNIHIVTTPWAPYTLLEFIRSSDTNRKASCPWFEPARLKSDTCIYRMMYEIAEAVCYLHRHSIKHKDIKPDNILLFREQTRALTPILTDVGKSKVFRPGSTTDYVKSSYQFLAPEQLNLQDSSLKADIWQLGCCFAMILAVSRGGTPSSDTLWSSFEHTDERCSCNIATESGPFMQTLKSICIPGDVAQEHAHSVTCRMLELNPLARIDVGVVKIELESLPRA